MAKTKTKPNPDSKKFKTPAERRKALLRIQQGGARQLGKEHEKTIKRIKVAETVAKTAVAIDTAAAFISPVGAAKKVVTKIATEAAKKMAKKVAEKKAARAVVDSAKVGARRVALEEEGKQIRRAAAKKKLETPHVRKKLQAKLKQNQQKAKQADIDAKPKYEWPKKGPTASTKPKQSGPDPRGSSATHDSQKAVRKANPQQYVTKHKGTKQEYPRLPKDTTKPLQGPGAKGLPRPSLPPKPKFGKVKVTAKKDPAAVKKKGADMSAAERKAREEAAKKLRKKSHGLSGREKLKAADASKANQAKGLASKQNFLTQGPKGAARRQRLGVKRDTKAGRKEAGRNFIVMEH